MVQSENAAEPQVNNQGVGPDGRPDRHNCSLLPAQQADAIEQLAAALESERDAMLAQKLGQLQTCIAVSPQECVGQLASFRPT